VREVLFASEETDERAAALSSRISERPTQFRVSGFQGVDDKPLGRWSVNLKLDLASCPCQRAEVVRQHDADHGSV
jgi:hypothetical protein